MWLFPVLNRLHTVCCLYSLLFLQDKNGNVLLKLASGTIGSFICSFPVAPVQYAHIRAPVGFRGIVPKNFHVGWGYQSFHCWSTMRLSCSFSPGSLTGFRYCASANKEKNRKDIQNQYFFNEVFIDNCLEK